MKTIAVMAQKGGTGKTTTATTIAYLLAQDGARVLLIDADQQGNTSQIMGSYDPMGEGLERLLEPPENAPPVDEIAQTASWEGQKKRPAVQLRIVPANAALMDANIDMATDAVHDQAHRLKNRLDAAAGSYDYAVIDCGLLLDMTAINALVAADLWIAPIKPGGFEVDGLRRMQEQLEELHQLNDKLVLWALPVMMGRSKAHTQILQHLCTLGAHVMAATVRRSIVAEKYTAAGVPLPVYSPRCGLVEDYRQAVEEIKAWNERGNQ